MIDDEEQQPGDEKNNGSGTDSNADSGEAEDAA